MSMKNSKTAISFLVHISKVNDEYYAAVESNLLDMADFGIDIKRFNQLGDDIQEAIRNLFKKRIENGRAI